MLVGRLEAIIPNWPAPSRVRALTTTRTGGVSAPPYASLNLAEHVGDVPDAIARNRARAMAAWQLPESPRWVQQVHGTDVVEASRITSGCMADASFTRTPGIVCAVLTADCLPVLFCDRGASSVAVAHAGWRGLASGILEATVDTLGLPPDTLMAWLGPAIGPNAFEVGEEVREAFVGRYRDCEQAFRPSQAGRWMADIYRLARHRLTRRGVSDIYGGGHCTVGESERFFSYRRDGTTGRMATLIWMEEV